MKKTTREELIDSISPEEMARKIFAYLEKNNGRKVSVYIERELRDLTGDQSIRIRKAYGMTHLDWGKYNYGESHQLPDHGSFLIAYEEKNVVIDIEKIREKNQGYLTRTPEVNRNIHQMLGTDMPEKIDLLKNRLINARNELRDFISENILDGYYFNLEKILDEN